MDEACIVFSQVFYDQLFGESKTPEQAFHIAQETLSLYKGMVSQASLFILKTKSMTINQILTINPG